MSAAVSPAAATTCPAAPQELEESAVIQRRIQKPRANDRASTGMLWRMGNEIWGIGSLGFAKLLSAVELQPLI